ncbi:DUF2971 domain-containing protein [Yoonia sp. R2331]|uniref:DUF2971 domain-containing protein n=1 Tax=Yoonia sp. R2331 TaxID=3237238 RepID=UPI0034E4D195
MADGNGPWQKEEANLLYHYTSLDTFLKMAEFGKIRLSDLAQSNDALEGRFIQDHISKAIWSSNIPKGLHSELELTIEHLIQFERAFGFCLSETPDQLSQWRGYGDDGHGVCLGFDQVGLESAIRNTHHETRHATIHKVEYGDESAAELGATVSKDIEALEISDADAEEVAFKIESFLLIGDPNKAEAKRKAGLAYIAIFNAISKCFRFKSHAFREEREWRVLHSGKSHDSKNVKYHSRGGRIVAYLDVDFGGSLREVILGPKTHVGVREMGRVLDRFGLNNNEASKIKVNRSSASYR